MVATQAEGIWPLYRCCRARTIPRRGDAGPILADSLGRTWADWSATFKCPVYMTEVDSVWANRTKPPPSGATLKLLSQSTTELLPGLTSVVCGGHFPGSQCLHSAPPNTPIPTLFVADTIFSVASSRNPDPGKRDDVISYQFLWSIPNFIPLPPDEVVKIWRALKPFDFKATYGVMAKITNVCEWFYRCPSLICEQLRGDIVSPAC
jgi:glyoxylase-like metal-dependent hydrolase (beta-lactamase superfamily II)